MTPASAALFACGRALLMCWKWCQPPSTRQRRLHLPLELRIASAASDARRHARPTSLASGSTCRTGLDLAVDVPCRSELTTGQACQETSQQENEFIDYSDELIPLLRPLDGCHLVLRFSCDFPLGRRMRRPSTAWAWTWLTGLHKRLLVRTGHVFAEPGTS